MSKDIVLAIDTSTPRCSLCLSVAGEIVVDSLSSACSQHNEQLAFLVDAAYGKTGVELADTRLIIIGSGPGSFTGLRIGYSFVSGLSAATEAVVKQVSSFEAVARLASEDKKFIAVTSDAGRGEYFVGIYSRESGGELKSRLYPEVLLEESFLHKFNAIGDELGVVDRQRCCLGLGERAVKVKGVDFENIENVARGLATGVYAEPVKEGWLSSLCGLAPDYVRGVHAKTIREREVDNSAVIE